MSKNRLRPILDDSKRQEIKIRRQWVKALKRAHAYPHITIDGIEKAKNWLQNFYGKSRLFAPKMIKIFKNDGTCKHDKE